MEESAKEIPGSSPDDDAVPMAADENISAPAAASTPAHQSYINYVEAIRRFTKKSSDPVDPSRITRRRAPRHPAGSPSVPVMSSPPRPRGAQEHEEWKIPSCMNAWKKPEKRLASVDHARISRLFAELAAALYAAEKKAREEAARNRRVVMTGLMRKAKERREQMLRRHADRAAKMDLDDVLRATTKRKKSKITKDAADREVGDTASTGGVAGSTQDEKGTRSVFAPNDDHVYSGRPCAAESTSHGDADEQQDKVSEKDRPQPDKGISGAPEKAGDKRERPAEFDEPPEQEDEPFGLEQFLNKFSCLGMEDFDLDELLGSMLNIS